MINIRIPLLCACTFIGAMAATTPTLASEFPSKPIKFVVPYPPGGGNDLFARLTADAISQNVHQPVIVENRPGAAGQIAGAAVAKADPDGYTIMVDQSSIATNPLLYKQPLFDVKTDLTPVIWGASLDNALLVASDSPIHSLSDLIAKAKANPEGITFGSPGHGSSQHLAMEALSDAAGIKLLHVPFKGTAQIISAVVAKDVDLFLISAATASRYTKDGKVRAIATTGKHRSSIMPDVPTVSESGLPGYTNYTWLGVFTTAGTPPGIVDRLNKEFSKALQDPKVKTTLSSQGWEIVADGPAALSAQIDQERNRYGPIIKKLQIQID
ncbi:tripartite tricarboxylate transporter substrate binding protein [Allopusillimonas soli]|uniref:Tripartite tricarboxylate transporter substrate binding protein n=1 Tax=Allopusillimonas soli TaxID=659016 RepID=A0A853FBK5_9BURK|nr:tripartite tricarboxylate transporter substrate binding protein [Allopusillimonas soli]NYT36280.1 tripartite tricarboxylate transporter substrate binding protein [Allopusillimonas soli]TEA76604.1 tripartite tricarboxylate transporter substrate binding protein [Allopusillimonas soli]